MLSRSKQKSKVYRENRRTTTRWQKRPSTSRMKNWMPWRNAAIYLSNLSVLQLALGAVADAVTSARKSAELADRGDDDLSKMALANPTRWYTILYTWLA